MKTIEEKAKAYDEAIEKLRSLYDDYDTVSTLIDVKKELENIFPELADSEGERIRKKIIKLVKEHSVNHERCQMETWLEKQGEHANFRNKIQIGDKVTRNEDGVLVNLSQLKRVAKKDENQGEQKPAEWSKDDERKLNTVCSLMYSNPAQDPFYAKVSLENWLKSLKDRVQRKQEWSEEDKAILEKCIGAVKVSCYSYSFKSEAENWLKSLRPQSQWKPSDNELEVLRLAAEKDGTCLMGLYEQLKKL